MTDNPIKSWIEERQSIYSKRWVERNAWAEAARDWQANFPRALNALEQVLDVHTRIGVEHAVYGPTDVCEQCSEDRLYTLWPCETVQAIEGAINHE